MAENAKRILVFSTAFRPFIGGSEIAIEEIVKRLPDVFFDIVTPRYKRNLPRLESGDNFRVHRVGWGWPLDKLVFPISGFLYSRKLIKESGCDFFHVFQASWAGGAAWLAKFFYPRVPLVLTLQEGKDLDSQSSFVQFARKLLIRKADRITVISNHLKSYVLKIRKNVPLAIIPNGVDVDNFCREFSYGELSALRDQLEIKPGEKVVISVSRLVPKNGLNNLIKAAAILSQKAGGLIFKLLLVGEGELKGELLKLVGTEGIKERVVFAGCVGRSELPKYLKISDVFVRPSLSEGLGSAFLEAMAAGIPAIGSKVGGIPDFIRDLETGLFCKPTDPQDIAEKISLVISDDSLRKKIVGNALELVQRRFNWNTVAPQYADLYERCHE